MNDIVFIVSIIALLIILFLYYEHKYSELTMVTSSINDKPYLVRNRDDKLAAANMLATIVKRIDILIQYSIKHKKFNRLVKKYNPNNISESLSNSKYTSFSVNKGEQIVFCIRNKDPKQSIVDLNTLMFVAIHELAHILSKSVGHNDEFWGNMRSLLKVGIKLNIYTPVDYSKYPTPYCGINITATP